MVLLLSRPEFSPLYRGHRWGPRVAEAIELIVTTFGFKQIAEAEAMGSHYGDAISGGGADNG
jgi:hypothetical protein